MNWFKKTMEKLIDPEKNKKLLDWQSKYETAKTKYADALSNMSTYENYYEGDKKISNISF